MKKMLNLKNSGQQTITGKPKNLEIPADPRQNLANELFVRCTFGVVEACAERRRALVPCDHD
jgi:hypothetical protein